MSMIIALLIAGWVCLAACVAVISAVLISVRNPSEPQTPSPNEQPSEIEN